MDTAAFREEAVGLIADMRKAGVTRFADELEDMIAVYLHREKEISRAAPDSAPVTKRLAREVKRYHRKNPNTSQKRIGEMFDIAPGTVSRILNDKWEQ